MLSASKSGSGLATGYNLTRSLRFRASASAYLNRTPAAGNQKTWTWSAWVKRGTLSTAQALFDTGVATASDSTFARFGFEPADTFSFNAYNQAWRTTTQVFRDPSAWYHIVLAFDTTQATAANRVKLYVNGVQVTAFSVSNDPTINTNYAINQAAVHYFSYPAYTYSYFDGYLTEVNFIDGQALTPTSFGSTNALTGVWQPARYAGTYGTNGFYLPFTDNSALTTSSNVGLGKDFSGNGNYWTTNNISITSGVTYDSMTDVPTLTSATASNFAVLNPLNTNTTLSDGNLKSASTINQSGVCGSVSLPYSKIYFEYTAIAASSNSYYTFGVIAENPTINQLSTVTNSDSVLYRGDGSIFRNTGSGFVVVQTVSGFTAGDIPACAIDLIGLTIQFYKNGAAVGTPQSLTSGVNYAPWVTHGYASTSCAMNFGQRPFSYTPPTGFVALNTYNLPTSTIVKGNTVMDATLYTGTGASLSVTNAASFKPDLVWLKSRSAATDHKLTDAVRGTTKGLVSDSTAAETTDAQGLTAFNSNGFTVGTDTTYNNLAATYVAWQWQAGQGSTSSNTNGTITSTVSVNASAGFSVVTYTGDRSTTPQTVGHGLGVAPALIIFKARNNAINWLVYHQSVGNTKALYLNLTDAAFTTSGFFNNTSPTSSVFTINTANENNGNLYTMVAYCWTPIAGFSAFGSLTGNGSADGPFTYTGFRPKFILFKNASAVASWWIFDTVRNTYNVADLGLRPNTSDTETTFVTFDILSNGFKVRTTDSGLNGSGNTVIYAAFAESPFRNSLAR